MRDSNSGTRDADNLWATGETAVHPDVAGSAVGRLSESLVEGAALVGGPVCYRPERAMSTATQRIALTD
jgi:hypothetical protein